jgi:hypothetical protein
MVVANPVLLIVRVFHNLNIVFTHRAFRKFPVHLFPASENMDRHQHPAYTIQLGPFRGYGTQINSRQDVAICHIEAGRLTQFHRHSIAFASAECLSNIIYTV